MSSQGIVPASLRWYISNSSYRYKIIAIMADSGLRQRKMDVAATNGTTGTADEHPGGRIKHGAATQVLRCLLLVTWFLGGCCTYVRLQLTKPSLTLYRICATQFLGVPLYWINRDFYYAYMALTKQSFGIIVTTLAQWWAPTLIRMSGDASVAGQIRKTADGNIECDFPERMVMIANHQVFPGSQPTR